MKLLKPTLYSFFVFIVSLRTHAVHLDYVLEVHFNDGPLTGTTEQVFVTLNGVTEIGEEDFTPAEGTLSAFNFEFGGTEFAVQDDSSFPALPRVTLLNGALFRINFTDAVLPTAGIVFLDGTPPVFNQVAYRPNADPDMRSQGVILANSWRPAQVPTPNSFALVALGVFALVSTSRSRQPIVFDKSLNH